MRATPCRFVTILALLGLLAACHQKPAVTEPLPVLMRPTVALQERNGRILVPQTALVSLGGAPGVFVLEADHTARFRMVRTGKSYDGRIEALSGLTGRESLVSGDLHDVHDGSPIQPR